MFKDMLTWVSYVGYIPFVENIKYNNFSLLIFKDHSSCSFSCAIISVFCPGHLPFLVNFGPLNYFFQGRKYMGANGRVMAATKIQSLWRRYRERTQYLEYRRLKWAAGVIAISWIMRIKMAKMRHQLRQTRLDQLEAFKRRSKVYLFLCELNN